MFWVAEHGRIFRGISDKNLDDGNLQLSTENFDSILTLLDDSTQPGLNPIFQYSRSYGRDLLTVQEYAGVIRTDSGCQIEILPKISRKADPGAARELLVKMLIELSESPFTTGTLADLHAHDMPLFEILMRQFLEHVGDIVRKGIARTYVSQQDNLIFLRGKLQLSEHIRRNVSDLSRLYCEFEEFEIDRPINRLIKGALEIVNRLSRDAINQQRCRELLYWFDRVTGTRDSNRDFRAVQQDRLIQHYAPAMPTCRLILDGLNPLTRQGESQVLSILFPMSQLFESYVSAKLGKQLPDWNVSTQVHGQSLIEKHQGEGMFKLIPDLKLRRGQENVIADTKWKLLDQSARQKNYGISQADVYQLFAYSRKYLANQVPRRVALIYPRTDSFDKQLPPFWFQENKEVLYVLPYDLDEDRLVMDEYCILFEAANSGPLSTVV